MKPGDRVRGPGGPGVIQRFHYEPVSLGTRNIRRIAWVRIQYDNGTAQFVPPNTITQEEPMTTIEPDPQPTPDPTPPPTEPPTEPDADDEPAPETEPSE